MYQILAIYLFVDKLIKTKFLFLALATLKHSVDQVDFQLIEIPCFFLLVLRLRMYATMSSYFFFNIRIIDLKCYEDI